MKAIMLMFDSLRKDMLSVYGNQDIITPNFDRLAKQCCQFDNAFVGSMPCMPARRDIQTGRYNFLHRSWGPMEPFDNSFPELLKKAGVYTHLVTDHKHYWREGGATYHPKFDTYEFVRGQEGDAWKGHVYKKEVICDLNEPPFVQKFKSRSRNQDVVNRQYMSEESQHPLSRTVQAGLDFLEVNKDADQFFLQIECFDPHEPFFVPKKYLDMYGIEDGFNGWPAYYYDNLSQGVTQQIKDYYKALITMCDTYVGKVLDKMDELNMWEDTMLIVTTDHGFLLGEHEWWGKNIMPLYNEVANIPFFFYHPNMMIENTKCHELVQNIDICPTILDFFGVDIPKEVQGRIIPTVIDHEHQNESILYGNFGSMINLCYKDYIYMRSPKWRNGEINEYTLMPTHINGMFSVEELQNIQLHKPFDFTKGIDVMKIKAKGSNANRFGNKLYSLSKDKKQLYPIEDCDIEYMMLQELKRKMKENDAPEELFDFYGLNKISLKVIQEEHKNYLDIDEELVDSIHFSNQNVLAGYLSFVKLFYQNTKIKELENMEIVDENILRDTIMKLIPQDRINEVMYQVNLDMRIG